MFREFSSALLLCGLSAACGSEADAPSAAELAVVDPATRAAPPTKPQQPRSGDPRIAACAAALEKGDLSKVQGLLLELGPAHSPEAVCLRARLSASQGDSVGAVRDLELARKLWPNEVATATAAEIHAAGGRWNRRDDPPALSPDQRARAACGCCCRRAGQAGLAHLLGAKRLDPAFFHRWPLSEAHRLLAAL
jgi:hypothetical protein